MNAERPIILVVDDNPTQQKVINILAEKFGFLTVVVSSGKEALSAIAACDTCFDAILMDVNMPDIDGIECTKRLKQFLKNQGTRMTPIIAITARASDEDRKACIEAGMDDYLSKPFAADDFRRMLLKWAYNATRPNLRLLPERKNSAESN
ncbi:MAG TPA: response regulator [Oculatellaceae cyanobacterium]